MLLSFIGFGQSIKTDQGNEARFNKDSTYDIHLSNIDKDDAISLMVFLTIKEKNDCQINDYYINYNENNKKYIIYIFTDIGEPILLYKSRNVRKIIFNMYDYLYYDLNGKD